MRRMSPSLTELDRLKYELRQFTHIQAILGNATIRAYEAPTAKEVLDFLEENIRTRQVAVDALEPPVPVIAPQDATVEAA